MSDIKERIDTARFLLPKQEVLFDSLPLINGYLLDLSKEDVNKIEQSLQASFSYKPGLTTITYVQLKKTKNTPPNPIQVLNYPMDETDALPTNRAIAKIGEVYFYWKLCCNAVRTGRYNIFDFYSFIMVPVYLDNNKQLSIVTSKVGWGNSLNGKPAYSRYVKTINYGGDSDFIGAWGPHKDVSVYLFNGKRVYIPHKNIGVNADIAQKVFDSSRQVYLSEKDEIDRIIKLNYRSFPAIVRQIIDNTLKYESTLSGFTITRAYCLHDQQFDEAILIEVLDLLSRVVNSEFSKNLSTSSTITAVDKLSSSLEEMYQQALPQYKYKK